VTTSDNAGPRLETKLFVPRLRRGLVARPRLTERLNRVAESKLALVSAPAGFGKTTLLAEWLAAARDGERSMAWLSLGHGDNEPAPFWAYLIAALQTLVPGLGGSALSLLQGPQPPPMEAVLATLLNELSAVPNDIVLVLDDYHVVDAPDVQDGMGFLLEHLPPQMHLVIATRADPALPLARLRARGELVEIRAADLRFTPDEAAAYLNGTMGLELAAADVEALEARTEGWIAALQLAALSMQGRADVASFIASFAGDDRYIVDYLVDEVLARQSEDVRSFLLRTAVLERLTGSLCDAVTGRDDGRAMLEALDRANLFLVALDDRRRWYRYHHLFADVLRARVVDEQPDAVPGLHRRASDWFERHGERSEAIRHAMAAGDFARAADLIELAIPEMGRARQEVTMRRWMDALPGPHFESRPVLAAGYAGVLMQTGELERVDALLRAAERWLERTDRDVNRGRDSGATVVVDRDDLRRLPAELAMLRAGYARITGDLAATMDHAHRALEVVDRNDHLARGGAASLLGLTHWELGDLAVAYRWFADGMESLEKGAYVSDVVGGAVTLADIRIAQGRLDDAMRSYERGLRLALDRPGPPLRGAADMHVGMADVLRERNDLAAGAEHLAASRALGDENGLPKNPNRWRVAAAGIRHAEGDVAGALDLLDQAEGVFFSDFSPDVRPIPAMKARLWISHGKLAEARGWARAHGVTATDAISYVRAFEHATLARVLLAEGRRDGAEGRLDEAIDLTRRLVAEAEGGGWNGAAIDALGAQALARHSRGDVSGALDSLARAFGLAEPEGYVRIFVDEGPAMEALLKEAAKRGLAPSYIALIQAGFATTRGVAQRKRSLIEPLSDRELEVLRLLTTDLSGPEIAAHLVVSLHTVRTHTKNIYAKLGVSSRRAAVRGAAELELLAPTGPR
jgi:ATP/maltotriose-dependent transcriptional regulator MalT